MKWHNYSYSSVNKIFRGLFSYFVYIGLYALRKMVFLSLLLAIVSIYFLSLRKQNLQTDAAKCTNSVLYKTEGY